jgi:hypothetical protein
MTQEATQSGTPSITQSVPDEDATLRALVAEAEALRERVRAAFRARWDVEQAPTYKTGGDPPENPAYDSSRRSYYLNWAAHDAGGLLTYLRQAVDASAEQRRHWYAKDREPRTTSATPRKDESR